LRQGAPATFTSSYPFGVEIWIAFRRAFLIEPTLNDAYAPRLVPNLKIAPIDPIFCERKSVSIVRGHNYHRGTDNVSPLVYLIGSVGRHLF
jgi:hypothetical protein